MTYALGVDVGSATVEAVLLDGAGRIVEVFRRPISRRPSDEVRAVVERAAERAGDDTVRVGVTGSGRDVVRGRAYGQSEIVSFALAVPALVDGARTAVEVGSQSARYVVVDPETGTMVDFGLNQQCAAGSGSFFEEQARRLGVGVEELAGLAAGAERGATVAGRCSVFAKSDMIHLQQKGTPVEEIAYGLCLAMARNFVATVIRGREVAPPVVIAGGAARNAGLVRAFSEVLGLERGEMVVSPHPGGEAALGAAIAVRDSDELQPVEARRLPDVLDVCPPDELRSRIAPLDVAPASAPADAPAAYRDGAEVFLGADVGSVSTNLVVMSPDGGVVQGVYLSTRGRPIEALGRALDRVRERHGERLRVRGVAVTGSGRHLASHLLGADLVKNEITCQLQGAVRVVPDVDTVFEIGGQDSKYVQVRDGHIGDFVMNKICAAGTGSFLEEQAEHLGVDIVDEFAERAARARAPADLGCQCTVFMHSEVVAARRRGVSTPDVCAGLAMSVARNYLERVVAGRPVGGSVVFQGGVARNPAVVAAFERILDLPVHVHPHAGLSGAIGAAHLVRSAPPARTSFRGLDACRDHEVRSFECRACSNRCQVNRIVVEGRDVHFGDACERYSSRVARGGAPPPSPAGRMRELAEAIVEPPARPRGRIGIPRCSTLLDQVPFWSTFFSSLGFEPVVSEPSSHATLQRGLRRLPAETCLPVKLAFGHVKELAERDLTGIFLPSILTRPGDDPRLSHSCPYVQTVPYMVRAALSGAFITPEVDLSGDDEAFVDHLAQSLGTLDVDAFAVEDAYHDACAVRDELARSYRQLGRAALDGARRAIVVIGKPYNVLDPYVNMNLLEQLRRLGELALPMWCLPFEREELDPGPATLPWSMNRDIMRAVRFCLRDERLFPVVVSSFGCGPDAFMRPHLERLLDGRRALVLEFDEHRAEAGLVTRLEAFLDEIDAPRARAVPPGTGEVSPRVEAAPEPRSPVRYVLPHFADHVYAYSGALKAAGHRVRVLDLPDERTLELGEARSSGKECHPFSILTGDLVRVALAERDGPEVFLYPGTMIPCLLHQYGEAHRMILEQMGVGGLSVQTPGFAGIKDMLGLELGARMWRGLVAVDLLIKMACETRPYELSPGATDEAHRRNLRDLERAIVADELSTTLAAITRRMRDIPVDRSCRRPVVGVAGDIYTRINPAGNQDLFAWLEERGCEVWPAPFLVDITDFSLRHGWRRAGLGDAAVLGALMVRKGVESWRVRRLLRGAVRRLDEPGYRQVLAMASPYLGENQNEVLVLNVAKMVHFARNGADGILNAACFNCMLGAVSSAITTRISADHGRIPITTLVYSSVRDSQRAALDAFVHQLTGPPTRHAEEPSVPLNPQR